MVKPKLYTIQINQTIEDKFVAALEEARIKLGDSTLTRIRLQEKMVDHFKKHLDEL